MRGVKGDVLTDKDKKELRRKNINHIATIGGKAIAPIGGGTASDGSSIMCRLFAMQLLREVKQHQHFFDIYKNELQIELEGKGIKIEGKMEFELIFLDGSVLCEEEIDFLSQDQCLSKNLCKMGFVVVERSTQTPIVVSLESQRTV